MNRFRDAVMTDQSLQARLRLARTSEEVVSIARSAGFDVDANELDAFVGGAGVSLSEPELETVSGALPCWCDPSVVNSKSCSSA